MKKLIIGLMCMGFILFSFSSAFGQARTFTKAYTYNAGHLDNQFSSRVIAKAYVKNMILDDMGTRAEGQLKQGGFPYVAEYTKAMMSCLCTIETVKEKWKNGKYRYKAKAKTNITNILTDLGFLREEKIPTEDIMANRAMAKLALREIEAINRNLAASSDKAGKKEAYDKAVNNLHAADWYEIARFSGFAEDYDGAIEAYTKAIEYNPELASAYRFRGQLYLAHLKDKEKAVPDLNAAMELYFNNAVSQRKSKAYQKCVDSLDIILGISSKNPNVYYQRAACNVGLKQQDKAKEDFQKAAKLGHTKAQELLTSKGITW